MISHSKAPHLIWTSGVSNYSKTLIMSNVLWAGDTLLIKWTGGPHASPVLARLGKRERVEIRNTPHKNTEPVVGPIDRRHKVVHARMLDASALHGLFIGGNWC